MESVLVIGAGFMGGGIAQVCAQQGFQVQLMDSSAEALSGALRNIGWSLEKLTRKGLLPEEPRAVLGRIRQVRDLGTAAEAGWVIEAVPEKEGLKKEIFQELDRLALPTTPLATNTSSIPITRIAEVTERPERVLGLHFFGPVPLMGLVEVVKGEKTSEEIFEKGVSFVRALGKTPVRVRKDIPGFVMNRIFSAAFREAVDLVAEGVVTPEDADLGMRLGYGWNAGPFEIADNAGLDTFVLIARFLRAAGAAELVPRSDLVERMVAAGRAGRKSGEGFYCYGPDGRRVSAARQDGSSAA